MRNDLDRLLRPLEQAKHARRRSAVRSRYALGSLALLATTAFLIFEQMHAIAAALILFFAGLAAVAFQLGRLARMPDPVPPEWLILAVECRLSREGRAALTPLLMTGTPTCDEALAWGRAERERILDDLREGALCGELQRH